MWDDVKWGKCFFIIVLLFPTYLSFRGRRISLRRVSGLIDCRVSRLVDSVSWLLNGWIRYRIDTTVICVVRYLRAFDGGVHGRGRLLARGLLQISQLAIGVQLPYSTARTVVSTWTVSCCVDCCKGEADYCGDTVVSGHQSDRDRHTMTTVSHTAHQRARSLLLATLFLLIGLCSLNWSLISADYGSLLAPLLGRDRPWPWHHRRSGAS